MHIYITEHGARLKKSGGKLEVEKEDVIIADYPLELIDAVTLFTTSQITSQAIEALSDNGAYITWVSTSGRIIGCIQNPKKINILRQLQQFKMAQMADFCLELSKKFIYSKLHNSATILKRQNQADNLNSYINMLEQMRNKAKQAADITALEGIEGFGARTYFEALIEVLPKNIGFEGRQKYPPTDIANSLFSFTYTLLLNEITIALINVGFNPYLGFMHKPSQGHTALASDLIEQWRAPVADSLVIAILQNNIITVADFKPPASNGGIYLNREGYKKLITAYEKRLNSKFAYVKKEGFGDSMREAIYIQAIELWDALEGEDATLYDAVKIR